MLASTTAYQVSSLEYRGISTGLADISGFYVGLSVQDHLVEQELDDREEQGPQHGTHETVKDGEYGTYKTVKAGFWPRLSGKNP